MDKERHFIPEEKNKSENEIGKILDSIALEAIEMSEFQEAVSFAVSRVDAIKEVRMLLKKHFPQIAELPAQDQHSDEEMYRVKDGKVIRGQVLRGKPKHEFLVAKEIVGMLRKQ